MNVTPEAPQTPSPEPEASPRERQHYDPEVKAQILRDLFSQRKSVAELAEVHGIDVNNIYNWQRQAFESMALLFQPKDREIKKLEKKLELVEDTLKRRELALLELSTEHCELKKKASETPSEGAGPKRRGGLK